MKRLLPLANHVLIQLENQPEKSGGGILLPENVRHLLHETETGRILEVGKGCEPLVPGSRVYVKTNHGTGMSLNGHKCVLMPYRDVLAVIQ